MKRDIYTASKLDVDLCVIHVKETRMSKGSLSCHSDGMMMMRDDVSDESIGSTVTIHTHHDLHVEH